MAEKILAVHSGKERVVPGEIINAKIDLLMANEMPTVLSFTDFRRLGCKKVFDRERIVLVADHLSPNHAVPEAETCKFMREAVREYGIRHYYEVGQDGGIAHVFIPDKGLVGPGDLVIGADSHTCTYGALGALSTGVGSTDMLYGLIFGEAWLKVPKTMRINYSGILPKGITGKDLILYTIGQIGVDGATYQSIEFGGEAVRQLSMASRFTMSNMAVEAGAKCGMFEPDDITEEYLRGRCRWPYSVVRPDPDATYETVLEIDVTGMEPQVSLPHLPENTVPISKLQGAKRVMLDQVFIGACTNGRLEDLQIAADILRGKKVNPRLRLIVIPGSQAIYLEAIQSGVIAVLAEAGAAVCTSCCGACGGRNTGVLAAGEKCAATTNRNFRGRMGSMESEVYLVSPAVAAASSIAGYIASPEEVQ